MTTISATHIQSDKQLWAGRIMSGLATAFLGLDAVVKVLELGPAMTGSAQLGFPESSVFGIGVALLLCVALYAIPSTAILGATLLTGYLGGAVATQVRVGNPLFSHTLAPVYVALLVWGGLWLRDARVRALLPRR